MVRGTEGEGAESEDWGVQAARVILIQAILIQAKHAPICRIADRRLTIPAYPLLA
ncbi:MAG TPA: hypothetical protein V6C65_36915 [Allocoleopsis sp.]